MDCRIHVQRRLWREMRPEDTLKSTQRVGLYPLGNSKTYWTSTTPEKTISAALWRINYSGKRERRGEGKAQTRVRQSSAEVP